MCVCYISIASVISVIQIKSVPILLLSIIIIIVIAAAAVYTLLLPTLLFLSHRNYHTKHSITHTHSNDIFLNISIYKLCAVQYAVLN